jgi:hypothetical protein
VPRVFSGHLKEKAAMPKKKPSKKAIQMAKGARRRLGPTTPLVCRDCGKSLSNTAIKRHRALCPACSKKRSPGRGGDAMERRLPGSFESNSG